MTSEREQLDRYHDTYRRASPFDDCVRRYTFQTFKPYLVTQDAVALELGCSDGLMTELISKCVRQVEVVDGSKKFLLDAKRRDLANVAFTHALFEEYVAPCKFNYIFATFVLTHIEDLTSFFAKVRAALAPGGLIFVAVPNSRVLSRQLARQMGLLNELMALSENDRNHGHRRAFDRVRLNRDLQDNGFTSIAQGGVLLKPLADFQMDKLMEHEVLKKEQLEGLYSLGLEYPDLCGTLFSVCALKE